MLFFQGQLNLLCVAFACVTIFISSGISDHVNCALNYTEFGVKMTYSENDLCVLKDNTTSFTCNSLNKERSRICLWNLCLKPHETLQTLDLSRNHFKDIPKGCFSKFPSLEILTISNNDQLGFNNLYNAMYKLNQTNIQMIYANNINQVGVTYPFPKNISLLLNNTSLRKLHLNYNEIQTLESGSIYYLPRTLEEISVRGNRLEIGLIFFELVWLIKLTLLDISFQCSTLEYRSRSRRNVQYIDDFDNTNYEKCLNDISYVNALKVLPSNLTTLIATGLLSGPNCIPMLSTRRNSKLSHIDISMDGYFKWVGPISVDPNFNIITTVNLSHNQCQFIKDGFFDNLTHLENLDISYNYLGDYFYRIESENVFSGLKHLKKLDMRKSNIRYLPKTLLKHNKWIESLVLSDNAMDEWTLDISTLDSLSYVDCSLNKLVTFPEYVTERLDMLSKDHNVTVDFHHNKILCTCENLHFLQWLFTTRVMVRLSAACTGYNGNITQAYKYLSKECRKDNSVREWLYPVQTICLLFILSAIAMVVYKKRWALIYRWYLFRLRQKGYTPIGGCDEGYHFDAFLSFADEDRPFVERVVTELEENSEIHFKVCIHYRDFTPGKSISKNIVSSVHSSRKTIVFMSRAYLRSQWCKYELQMAITKERHMDRRLIIMVVLEDIPHNQLSLEVLQYYKKNSYIVKPKNEQELNLFWKTFKGVIANDL
nr:toll-like receptor 4 [Crassostrea gigas]